MTRNERTADVTPPVPPVSEAWLGEAVELLKAAGQLTLRWFQSTDLQIDTKGDGSPVTAADRAAERFIRDYLATNRPSDSIIGEEEASFTGSSDVTWIVDPIDGTKAFTHGVPLYSNLLACYDQYGPAIGIINIPALGETVAAGRGLGCFFNDLRCHVSTVSELADAYVCTSGLDNWPTNVLVDLAATTKLRTWGDGYGYSLVATGRVDAMVDPQVEHYDVAPMLTIMSEAGGAFTDFEGQARATGGSGVATNGRLHDQLLLRLTR